MHEESVYEGTPRHVSGLTARLCVDMQAPEGTSVRPISATTCSPVVSVPSLTNNLSLFPRAVDTFIICLISLSGRGCCLHNGDFGLQQLYGNVCHAKSSHRRSGTVLCSSEQYPPAASTCIGTPFTTCCVTGPTPTPSPTLLLAQAIFEPNLLPYEYPKNSQI